MAQPSVEPGTTLVNYLLSVARSRLHALEDDVAHSNRSSDDGVGDLITLLTSITLAVKSVGALVRSFGISPGGRTGGEHASEKAREELANLNERANAIWINSLLYSQKACLLVSEELEEPVVVDEEMRGKYAVVFDPLTGLADPPSQDMGTIFGIFHRLSSGTAPGLADVMQPARNLVAAGYALYGSCTVLMFSVGEGCHMFTLDPSLNEFIMTQDNVKIPFSGNIYSINEGRTKAFDDETQEMLKCIKAEPALDGSQRCVLCRSTPSLLCFCSPPPPTLPRSKAD